MVRYVLVKLTYDGNWPTLNTNERAVKDVKYALDQQEYNTTLYQVRSLTKKEISCLLK